MPAPWKIDFDLPDTVTGRSIGNAIHEGRLSAMRWLILYVGIGEYGRKAVRAPRSKPATDAWIGQFGSRADSFEFPLNPDADKLALVYRGCAQATGHPTQGSGHPDVDERPLSEAIQIVIAHLQATVYKAHGLNLVDATLRMDDLPFI
jgi:hypothetical protein